MKKEKCGCNNLIIILMIICVLLSLTTLGIVVYDKYIKTDSNACTCTSCVNK